MTTKQKLITITKDNYFSEEMNWIYMHSSQWKSLDSCEAMGMAMLRKAWLKDIKAWKPKDPQCFTEGHYFHAWNDYTLGRFKIDNPGIFSSQGPTKGQLKTAYKHIDEMIKVASRDEIFMDIISGQKEVIFTAEMFGTPWAIMIDSYNTKMKRFCDLKALMTLNKTFRDKESELIENVIEHYKYHFQVAIYAEIERIANGRPKGDYLEPFLAIVTKETPPNKEIISFSSNNQSLQSFIDEQLFIIEKSMPRILAVKKGEIEPARCGVCPYCIFTKKIEGSKHYLEI